MPVLGQNLVLCLRVWASLLPTPPAVPHPVQRRRWGGGTRQQLNTCYGPHTGPNPFCEPGPLLLKSTLEIETASIPILQRRKPTPKEEAHSQLPEVHQLRTGITSKATLQGIYPALFEAGSVLSVTIKANIGGLLAYARHQYEHFTRFTLVQCSQKSQEACRIVPILQAGKTRLREVG